MTCTRDFLQEAIDDIQHAFDKWCDSADVGTTMEDNGQDGRWYRNHEVIDERTLPNNGGCEVFVPSEYVDDVIHQAEDISETLAHGDGDRAYAEVAYYGTDAPDEDDMVRVEFIFTAGVDR